MIMRIPVSFCIWEEAKKKIVYLSYSVAQCPNDTWFAYVQKFSLKFLSSSFALRVNHLHT